MSFFMWGSSKPSKLEGIPLDEIRWLQKSLQQGMQNVDILECNSEALKTIVESQTYMAQKLQQEMRSCNLQNVLTDKGTQTDETNNSGDAGSDDVVSFDRLANEDYLASDIYHEETESAVDPPSKQQEQHEYADDILVKLLLNNQTVLMNQAIVIQKAVQNSTQWLQNLQQQVDSLFSQNFESSLNDQYIKYKALEEEKNQLNKKWKEIEEENKQQSKKWMEAEEEKNQLSKKLKEIEEEKQLLYIKCCRLEVENNKLSEKCKNLEDEIDQLSKKCKELEEGIKESQKEFEKLKKDCDRLSTENSYLKNPATPNSSSGGSWHSSYNTVSQKKPVTTQVYCPMKSDLMTNVVSELSNTLQLQMSLYHLDLVMQMCDTPNNINRSLPVIVICLYASHLHLDVSNALQGVQTGPDVAVLILHHLDLHALPTQSSEQVLTGSEYKNVGAIIDMAYLTNKGMYTCDMNNKALETLMEFIKTHSQP